VVLLITVIVGVAVFCFFHGYIAVGIVCLLGFSKKYGFLALLVTSLFLFWTQHWLVALLPPLLIAWNIWGLRYFGMPHSIKKGDADAQFNLGGRNAQTNIETHDNDAQNVIKAARLLTEAEQGNAEAQEALGFFYCIGAGVPRDYVQAAKWFRKAAEQGNAEGQYRLGLSYYNGEGVPKDYAQATFWWRKAAEQGNDTAQYNLKYLLHYDYAQAAAEYRKAAEQGDAQAQYNLGASYSRGQGVPQDDTQAAAWYRKAAEQGNASAQYGLGFLYAIGQGVPQDYAQAAFWYREAAEQGDAQAQFQLGALYDDGLGVPQNYAEAYFWLELVAAGKLDTSDSKQIAKYRDRMASHLTPADLSRQQERARKWLEAHQAKP
jgi:TPR repeat protein